MLQGENETGALKESCHPRSNKIHICFEIENLVVELKIGLEFRTFAEAEKAVNDFCETKFHAVGINNKVSIRNANKRAKVILIK